MTNRATDARTGQRSDADDRTGQVYEIVIDEAAIEHRAPRRDLSPSEALRLAERGPVRPAPEDRERPDDGQA